MVSKCIPVAQSGTEEPWHSTGSLVQAVAEFYLCNALPVLTGDRLPTLMYMLGNICVLCLPGIWYDVLYSCNQIPKGSSKQTAVAVRIRMLSIAFTYSVFPMHECVANVILVLMPLNCNCVHVTHSPAMIWATVGSLKYVCGYLRLLIFVS